MLTVLLSPERHAACHLHSTLAGCSPRRRPPYCRTQQSLVSLWQHRWWVPPLVRNSPADPATSDSYASPSGNSRRSIHRLLTLFPVNQERDDQIMVRWLVKKLIFLILSNEYLYEMVYIVHKTWMIFKDISYTLLLKIKKYFFLFYILSPSCILNLYNYENTILFLVHIMQVNGYHLQTQDKWILNNLRISKWWNNFNFWVKYPFKRLVWFSNFKVLIFMFGWTL